MFTCLLQYLHLYFFNFVGSLQALFTKVVPNGAIITVMEHYVQYLR